MYTESTTGLDNIHVLPALLIAVLTVIIANEECVLIYPDTANSIIVKLTVFTHNLKMTRFCLLFCLIWTVLKGKSLFYHFVITFLYTLKRKIINFIITILFDILHKKY